MRLINTATREFEEFLGRDKPEYAILSHTWRDGEEVSYRDYKRRLHPKKQGYQKIEWTCKLASDEKIQYAWIDTCCIDKSSSAELSEAINSMYKWYQRARTCYVFLEDLCHSAPLESMKSCRWFTRGWTLQELIAPPDIQFFDQDWKYRGSKTISSSKDISDFLSRVTGIPQEVLLHRTSLAALPIAQKMSWASRRETSRIEDMAYCLLGIFDVNMPLMYGEEHEAFRRLQVAMLLSHPDLSIFAWRLPADKKAPKRRMICGLLAQSPSSFASCDSLVYSNQRFREELAVTNVGIKTRAQICTTIEPGQEGRCYVLDTTASFRYGGRLFVRLRKCGMAQYARSDPFTLFEDNGKCEVSHNVMADRYLMTDLIDPALGICAIMDESTFMLPNRLHVLQVRWEGNSYDHEYRDVLNSGMYDDQDGLFFLHDDTTMDAVALRFNIVFPRLRQTICCGFYAVGWA